MTHHGDGSPQNGKIAATETGYLLAQSRFPRRLEKVRRLGVEIAMSECKKRGVSGPTCVRFNDFQIVYITPFNRPTHGRWMDRDNNQVRFLYGLSIFSRRGSCLRVCWEGHDLEHPELDVELFRDPTGDDWD